MSYASTSVAPGSYPSVRRKVTTGVAVAGAGILALGLVVVPPDFDDVRTDLRTVQFASLALPSALPSPVDLERFVENLVGTELRVPISVFNGDASGITASSTTSPRTFDLTIDPSTSDEEVNNASVGSALGLTDGVSIPGLVLAAAFAAFLFGVLIPAAFVNGFIGYNVIDPILGLLGVGGTSTATVDGNPSPATLSADGQSLTLEPESGQLNNAALAETPTGGSILDPILPIIGPIILFAPLFILLIPALPILLPSAAIFYAQEAISYLLNSLSPPPDPAPAPTAMVEAKTTLTSDQLPSDSGLATLTTKHKAEGTPGAEKAKTEAPPAAAASTAPSPQKEQIQTEPTASKEDVDKPAKENHSPASEKPAVRPETNSSVARGLTEGRERAADLDAGRSTTKPATGGKKTESRGAAVAEAQHPSRDDNPKGASTSDDDADGS